MRLNGQHAVVTGAGQDFGAEIAATFAREGARVACLDLNREAALDVAARIGRGAIGVGADVTVKSQVDGAAAAILPPSAASIFSSTTPASPTATGRCSKSAKKSSTA